MSLLTSWIPLLGTAVDKLLGLIPDSNAKAKAEAEFNRAMLDIVANEGKENREINRTEAAHESIFVAGWRPAIGWVCALALAFQYLIRPFWIWIVTTWYPDTPIPPSLDDMLWELICGMLGISGLKTFENVKGNKLTNPFKASHPFDYKK